MGMHFAKPPFASMIIPLTKGVRPEQQIGWLISPNFFCPGPTAELGMPDCPPNDSPKLPAKVEQRPQLMTDD
jgi:hypothetical protein